MPMPKTRSDPILLLFGSKSRRSYDPIECYGNCQWCSKPLDDFGRFPLLVEPIRKVPASFFLHTANANTCQNCPVDIYWYHKVVCIVLWLHQRLKLCIRNYNAFIKQRKYSNLNVIYWFLLTSFVVIRFFDLRHYESWVLEAGTLQFIEQLDSFVARQ